MIDTEAIGMLNELTEHGGLTVAVAALTSDMTYCVFCLAVKPGTGEIGPESPFTHADGCLILRAQEVVDKAELSPLDAVRQSFSTEAQQRNAIGGT